MIRGKEVGRGVQGLAGGEGRGGFLVRWRGREVGMSLVDELNEWETVGGRMGV